MNAVDAGWWIKMVNVLGFRWNEIMLDIGGGGNWFYVRVSDSWWKIGDETVLKFFSGVIDGSGVRSSTYFSVVIGTVKLLFSWY